MLPPQAEKMECPGEIAGCVARFEALDLNHANWQSPASQASQNGSSRTTSSCLQVDPVKLTREEPCSECFGVVVDTLFRSVHFLL